MILKLNQLQTCLIQRIVTFGYPSISIPEVKLIIKSNHPQLGDNWQKVLVKNWMSSSFPGGGRILLVPMLIIYIYALFHRSPIELCSSELFSLNTLVGYGFIILPNVILPWFFFLSILIFNINDLTTSSFKDLIFILLLIFNISMIHRNRSTTSSG